VSCSSREQTLIGFVRPMTCQRVIKAHPRRGIMVTSIMMRPPSGPHWLAYWVSAKRPSQWLFRNQLPCWRSAGGRWTGRAQSDAGSCPQAACVGATSGALSLWGVRARLHTSIKFWQGCLALGALSAAQNRYARTCISGGNVKKCYFKK
jgi:hypothetical protein